MGPTAHREFAKSRMNQPDHDSSDTTSIVPPERRSIVLVGLMGAGKSTVGRRLAHRLKLPFLDADSEIEAAAGMSISDIFATYGEAHFRDGEVRVIRRLLSQPRHVLATGGGAFMRSETRQAIAENGISVWLRADLDTLVKRVSRRGGRPLLAEGDARETLSGLIAERYPVYALADIIVDTGNGPHETVVDAIIEKLKTWVERKA